MKTLGFLLAFVTAMTSAPAADVGVVGFESAHVSYGSEAPLVAGIWYPSSAPLTNVQQERWPGVVANAPITGARLPLVVLSHGGGGSYEGHYDTAIALARAGFVVAAVSHAGDTYDDESKVLQRLNSNVRRRLRPKLMPHVRFSPAAYRIDDNGMLSSADHP